MCGQKTCGSGTPVTASLHRCNPVPATLGIHFASRFKTQTHQPRVTGKQLKHPMKTAYRRNSFTAALPSLAAISLCLFAAQAASAGSRTWSGGGDENWSTPANWDVLPVANDSLIFTGSTGASPNNDFPAGTIFNNIYFDGSAGSFTLGGNGLVLTNGLNAGSGATSGGSITNASSSIETINLPVTLSAGKHNLESDGGQLNINAALSRNKGAIAVFTPNATINTTAGLANDPTGIIGGWATLGTGWAALDANSNVVSYSAYTPISAGLIANGPANNLLYSGDTANLIAAGGTVINSFIAQTTAARFWTNVGITKLGPLGAIYRNASSTGVFTVTGGTITASGGGEISLYDGALNATANNLAIASIIADDGANPVAVNVVGYAAINGANTFTGGCYISQGRVQTGNLGAYGKGQVFVYEGGEAFLNTGGNFANPFFVYGSGTTEASGGSTGPGAIRMNSTSAITNVVTLLGNTRISTSSTSGPQINGQITGVGPLEFCTFATDASVLVLGNGNTSAPNNWTGNLQISSLVASRKVFIKLGTNEQIPDSCTVTMNATDIARFDLNGHSETIDGFISGTGNVANMQVTNSGAAPSTLTIGANNFTNATFAGSFSDAGTANNLSIAKVGSGTQTLTGAINAIGNVTVGGGTLILSGTASLAKSANIVVTNSGTLNVTNLNGQLTTTNNMMLTNGVLAIGATSATATNFVVNNLNLGGAGNTINLSTLPAVGSYPANIHLIKYTTLNGAFNVAVGPLPPPPAPLVGTYIGHITNNVATSTIDLVLTSGPVPVRALTWTGTDANNPSFWDVATSFNWKDTNGTPTIFNQLDFTTFDDSAPGSTTVSLTTALIPSSVTVSNNSKTYTFTGSGNLNGSWTLNKQGTGLLIMDNGTVNGFQGTTINGGTVQVGNNDSAGDLGDGSIVNNGTLVFDRTDNPFTVTNPISGSGGITQSGTGELLLSNNNTFNGPVTITQGVLQVGTATSLGSSNASLTINSGASLDLNGNNLGSKPIFVRVTGASGTGLGAIDNTGSNVFPAVAFVTLLGDTTFGTSGGVGGSTTKGRWDLRAAAGDAANPTNAMLSTGGHPYNLTITGGALLGIVSATVDTNLANIDIQGGKLDYEGGTTGLGDPSKTISIENSAFLFLFATSNALNKNILINNGGTVENNNSVNTIVGPITLNTNADASQSFCEFQVDGTTTLNLNGPITGGGTLYKNTGTATGTGTLNLNGLNSFTGPILASAGTLNINGDSSAVTNSTSLTAGTLNLNGLLSSAITTSSGTALGGGGTNFGPVDVSGSFLPGGTNTAGTFTIYGGLTLEGSANLDADLSNTNTIGGGNDLVLVVGDVTLNGGTITINPFGLLATGVPYRIINYTGALVNNGTPSVPDAAGYSFVLDTSVPGEVNVIASGGPPVWTGASATDSDWSDAANFNGVSVTSGSLLYFSGPNRLNNTNDTTADTAYGNIVFPPGAAAFTLNGNPLTPSGSIMNNSTNAQTINLGLDFSANFTLSGGANASSPLIIGGGLTNLGTGFSTVQFAGTGILTNLLASTQATGTNTISLTNSTANWTLVDNGSSTPITVPWTFDIRAGIFNFGTVNSAPTLSNTTVNGTPQDEEVGVVSGASGTFNMVNGTLTTIARLNTATVNTSTGIVNQVGGILNIGQQFQGANGATSGALSMVNVSGGTMNLNGGSGQLYVASRDQGILNVSGTAAINCGNLDVSRNANGNSRGSSGVVNLNGGTLTVGLVGTATANSQAGPASSGVNPTATFNFNGGKLRARANSATFFQGSIVAPVIPISAIVKAGGAIIDDNGFAVSVLEPLQHDSSLGAVPDGGLTKLGTGTLTLTSASTYTGNTVVNGGTLAVNGSLPNTSVLVNSNGNLSGTGSVGGTVTVTNGGTVSPGGAAATGTLTVAGSVTNLAGATNRFLIARGLVTSNSVLVSTSGSITYAGALVVTNSGTAYAAGDSFKLFNASSYSGSFGSIVPATPAAGLLWNTTNLAVNGTLSVLAAPAFPATLGSITIAGTNLTISGFGGAQGGTFRVLSSPTLVYPIRLNTPPWTQIGTGSFNSDGHFTFNGSINPADTQRYYALVSP